MPAAAASDKALDRLIRQNLAKLRKPGVLTVRPGFEIAGHQLTGKRAIVATVGTKKAKLPASSALPNQVGGVPVDVRQSTTQQRLRAKHPLSAALAQTMARPEDLEPSWPLEREMPSGRLLSDPRSDTQKTLNAQKRAQPGAAAALAARQSLPQIPYTQPTPAPPLTRRAVNAAITASVSPDSGFATLTSFLNAAGSSLVIGMYDFTSGPILSAFKAVFANNGNTTLQMVLDSPGLNETADQSDEQTVAALNAALNTAAGSRSGIVRALTNADLFVTDRIFFDYHIKVIVRDGNALWLSSGNLNNSNEPDPSQPPPSTEDRDWHVIVEDQGLAQLFTAYLTNDFQVAAQNQLAPSAAEAAALQQARRDEQAEAKRGPPRAGQPPSGPLTPAKRFPGLSLNITPLLTPDPSLTGPGQYLTEMMNLIGSAQQKLYVQLQYIEASDGKGGDYDTLLAAIRARVQAGVDVRLIVSADFADKNVEKMKSGGVNLLANMRRQPSVHNKGFIVDSKTVVVSSQNFSPAGVRANRDAGLIMESPELAAYFEPIFLADWTNALPIAPNG